MTNLIAKKGHKKRKSDELRKYKRSKTDLYASISYRSEPTGSENGLERIKIPEESPQSDEFSTCSGPAQYNMDLENFRNGIMKMENIDILSLYNIHPAGTLDFIQNNHLYFPYIIKKKIRNIHPFMKLRTFPGSRDINRLVSITGTIIRINPTFLTGVELFLKCLHCNFRIKKKSENFQFKKLNGPDRNSFICKKCKQTNFTEETSFDKAFSLQSFYLQDIENPQTLSETILIENPNAPINFLIGESVTILGLIKLRLNRSIGKFSPEIYIEAHSIRQNTTYHSLPSTYQDSIEHLSPFEKQKFLIKNFATEIVGYENIKLGLLLSALPHSHDTGKDYPKKRMETKVIHSEKCSSKLDLRNPVNKNLKTPSGKIQDQNERVINELRYSHENTDHRYYHQELLSDKDINPEQDYYHKTNIEILEANKNSDPYLMNSPTNHKKNCEISKTTNLSYPHRGYQHGEHQEAPVQDKNIYTEQNYLNNVENKESSTIITDTKKTLTPKNTGLSCQSGHETFNQTLIQKNNLKRKQSHILLIGPTGTGKSTFLNVISQLRRSIHVNAVNTSECGLSASAIRSSTNPHGWELQPGALLLSHNGLCLIDNFSFLSSNDKLNLLEVMEQRTLSINKATISSQMKANCTIIAAQTIGHKQQMQLESRKLMEIRPPLNKKRTSEIPLNDSSNRISPQNNEASLGYHEKDNQLYLKKGDGHCLNIIKYDFDYESPLLDTILSISAPLISRFDLIFQQFPTTSGDISLTRTILNRNDVGKNKWTIKEYSNYLYKAMQQDERTSRLYHRQQLQNHNEFDESCQEICRHYKINNRSGNQKHNRNDFGKPHANKGQYNTESEIFSEKQKDTHRYNENQNLNSAHEDTDNRMGRENMTEKNKKTPKSNSNSQKTSNIKKPLQNTRSYSREGSQNTDKKAYKSCNQLYSNYNDITPTDWLLLYNEYKQSVIPFYTLRQFESLLRLSNSLQKLLKQPHLTEQIIFTIFFLFESTVYQTIRIDQKVFIDEKVFERNVYLFKWFLRNRK